MEDSDQSHIGFYLRHQDIFQCLLWHRTYLCLLYVLTSASCAQLFWSPILHVRHVRFLFLDGWPRGESLVRSGPSVIIVISLSFLIRASNLVDSVQASEMSIQRLFILCFQFLFCAHDVLLAIHIARAN
jgi:hypothetical protein